MVELYAFRGHGRAWLKIRRVLSSACEGAIPPAESTRQEHAESRGDAQRRHICARPFQEVVGTFEVDLKTSFRIDHLLCPHSSTVSTNAQSAATQIQRIARGYIHRGYARERLAERRRKQASDYIAALLDEVLPRRSMPTLEGWLGGRRPGCKYRRLWSLPI